MYNNVMKNPNMARNTSGSKNPNHRHGFCGTKIYKVWENMYIRCCNKNSRQYKDYGGRGITMHSEWLADPGAFCKWALSNGYREGLYIDRIDNDGNYEPGNVRFVERKVNNRNKRNCKYITAFGETKSISDWAEDPRCVVSYGCLQQRLYKLGLEPLIALTMPSIGKKGRAKDKWQMSPTR